jgi:hypothetical protein
MPIVRCGICQDRAGGSLFDEEIGWHGDDLGDCPCVVLVQAHQRRVILLILVDVYGIMQCFPREVWAMQVLVL